jgi:hypothetical protein
LEWNFDDLLEKIWVYLDMNRIYTKPKGRYLQQSLLVTVCCCLLMPAVCCLLYTVCCLLSVCSLDLPECKLCSETSPKEKSLCCFLLPAAVCYLPTVLSSIWMLVAGFVLLLGPFL